MFSIPEFNAFQRRLAGERVTRIIEHSMRSHSAEPGMRRPAEWPVERHRNPAILLMMTSPQAPGKRSA